MSEKVDEQQEVLPSRGEEMEEDNNKQQPPEEGEQEPGNNDDEQQPEQNENPAPHDQSAVVDAALETHQQQDPAAPNSPTSKNKENQQQQFNGDEEEDNNNMFEPIPENPVDQEQNEYLRTAVPSTELEHAMKAALERKDAHIERLTGEIQKLQAFISKRKQTYKRKRKDDGAPTRALSAYNIFIKERFAQLAKENEEALKSSDSDAVLKRVPPANLVAKTGNEWKDLAADIKAKYEVRAKEDRKRYDEQMAQYQPPDKQSNRKRNKTGYNMFFSAHVLRLKQTDSGVPSERGSVARLVGTAWKQLSADEKQYYEREADKHNGMHPVKEGEDEEEDEDLKRHHMEHYHMHHAAHTGEMHMHGAVPPPMMQHPQHDPRHHGYYMYGQPAAYGHYDYSQHHQRHQQARAQGYSQYPPQRHPYEGGM